MKKTSAAKKVTAKKTAAKKAAKKRVVKKAGKLLKSDAPGGDPKLPRKANI
ncbi:hypothetical protein SAMN04488109_2638 [Chryseolinea serpens]|uniref:Uncharacterized protein n=1 Tax=Chryseolinea serpens TaxID=947013 RepID=A0A1M5P2H0_9BACT|nr:hypothetical protein [Chryseolinea serpens]SHG95905.1 hypothetical protein SAMN04488109_2638 [Chryseolinea serpens]